VLVAEAPLVDAPLGSLVELLAALDEADVAYCLWKSNSHLAAALGGATDLDMLVERSHADRFRALALRRGCKPLVAPSHDAVAGMEHYLGLDPVTTRLFHLHVHYELVLGQKHAKNHRLPLERAFLGSTRVLHGVRVPSAEMELMVLVVRTLLKYRARDLVKDVLGIRSPGVPAELRSEIGWLLDQTSTESMRTAARVAGGVVPAAIVERFTTRLEHDPRAGVATFRLRRELLRVLRAYEREPRWKARARYARALVRKRRRSRDARLRPSTGGRAIALIGADGSGKSTTVDLLERWLGWKLQVRAYYLGSKQPSRRTRALYLVFRALRRAHSALDRRQPFSAARVVAGCRDAVLAAHFLSIARDRSRRVTRSRRDVAEGRLVLFDRYPVRPLTASARHQVLDGPHIASEVGTRNALLRALSRHEDRLYARLPLPDHVVVLDVSPSVAVARKPDHDVGTVTAKTDVVRELFREAARASQLQVDRVDADQDAEAVAADVRRAVWRGL